jgi:5'-nucleotidase
LGINVLYSGTVAGATEGAVYGITSVAVSLEYDEHAQFDRAAEIAVELIQQILAHEDAAGHNLYNINIPTSAFEGHREVRVVPMATVGWAAEFDRRVDPKGRRYYWATGTAPVPTAGELTDLEAWQKGYITLTPLRIDRTERGMLEQMRNWKLTLK